jgi:hypothetical protein
VRLIIPASVTAALFEREVGASGTAAATIYTSFEYTEKPKAFLASILNL